MAYTITENVNIAKNTWRMAIRGDMTRITRPGQFVQLQVPGFYLRRPISVCDFDESTLTLIYKVIGHGTEGHDADATRQPGRPADGPWQRLHSQAM